MPGLLGLRLGISQRGKTRGDSSSSTRRHMCNMTRWRHGKAHALWYERFSRGADGTGTREGSASIGPAGVRQLACTSLRPFMSLAAVRPAATA